MANIHNDLNSLFSAVADSIRTKKESTEKIIADNFPDEIRNLKTGFDYINQDVASIPDYAFYGCEDLRSVDCYNVASVGASAFENCTGLKTVVLYDGVVSVGENAFKGCNCVIYCKADSIPETWHENWNPDDCFVMFGKLVETWDISATSDDSVTAELYDVDNRYTLCIYGKGDMLEYTMSSPSPWESSYADSIVSVIIFNGVTNISKRAFYYCKFITSIAIPNSVTSISERAFFGCTSLTSIDIPNSITSIDSYAFFGCTGLTSITTPDSVTSIGNYAFQNCTGLTSIIIPDSVTSIGSGAFAGCADLTSINISDSVTSIGDYVFMYCDGLTSITIPDGVTSIGSYTFQSCKSLTSITIPDSVTRIGYKAIEKCKSLASITYTGTVAQWNAISFSSLWNYDTPNYTTHCTDGDIAKNGTITYHESNTGEGDA